MGIDFSSFKPTYPLKLPVSEEEENKNVFDNFKRTVPTGQVKGIDSSELDSEIQRLSVLYKVPPSLVRAMMQRESSGNPRAVSPAGAQGLMQLMPDTAKSLGVKDPLDWRQNLEGGIKYLKSMYERFGTWEKAAAAYNAGPNAVNRYKGVPPYQETQNYIAFIKKQVGDLNRLQAAGGSPIDFSGFQSTPQPLGDIRNFNFPITPSPRDKPGTEVKRFTTSEKFLGYFARGVEGVVTGLTGMPVTEEQKLKHPITGKELPESKTAHGVGEFTGVMLGFIPALKVARLSKVGAFAGRAAALVKKAPATTELLTNFALAAGGQTAIKSAVNQLYTTDKIDVGKLGTEAGIAAGLTFAFPAAGAAFGAGLRGLTHFGFSAADFTIPLVGRLLPGVAPIPRGAIKMAGERIRPFMLPGKAIRATASLLQHAKTPQMLQDIGMSLEQYGIRTGQQNYVSWGKAVQTSALPLRNLGHAIDAGLDSLSYQAVSPTNRGLYNLGPEWRVEQLYTAGEAQGVGSKSWNAQVANILEYQSRRLAANKATRGFAWKFKTAAIKLRKGDSFFDRNLIDLMNDVINNGVDKGFYGFPIKGATKYSPNREGQYLILLRDLADLGATSGKVHRQIEGGLRSWISHTALGFGNLASAGINMLQLGYTVAADGAENAAWAALQIQKQTAQGKMFQNLAGKIGKGGVTRLVTGIRPKEGLPTILSRLSFGPFSYAENQLRPIAIGANFKKLVDMGMPQQQALKEAIKANRLRNFNYDFDLPAMMRKQGPLGSAIRVALQFTPFMFKSTEFLATLGMADFANYVGFGMAVAGIKGVPFTVAADRMWSAFTSHSILNNIMSDPDVGPYVRGLAGLAGVDIGDRYDFTQNLLERVLMMDNSAFQDFTGEIAESLYNFVKVRNPKTAIDLAKSVLPIQWRNLVIADEAEYLKTFTNRAYFPQLENPTEKELVLRALGFIPTDLAVSRAWDRMISTTDMQERNKSAQALAEYRRAYLSQDEDAINAAREKLAEFNIPAESRRRTLKEVRRPPAKRTFKRITKRIRGEFVDRMRELIERGEEREE